MALPHLLLVDDSEAILAYEKATLGRLYTLTTASNGAEAIERARAIRPDAILLDLSMPEMNGEEVLRRVRADPDLADTPVVIVSSEHARGEACVAAGATAFLPKPIRADDLRALVARVLEEAERRESQGNLAVLFIGVGPLDVAIPLEPVRAILPQVETQRLPSGPTYLREFFTFRGAPVAVLDLAKRLRVAHSEPLTERRLVVLEIESVRIAICVDRVRDPEDVEPENVIRARALGGGEKGIVEDVISGIVKTAFGPVPVIAPHALTTRTLLSRLGSMLENVAHISEGITGPDERARVSETP
jgi:CheY-like chemotaxis protein/chemotaxis signal transduction protein